MSKPETKEIAQRLEAATRAFKEARRAGLLRRRTTAALHALERAAVQMAPVARHLVLQTKQLSAELSSTLAEVPSGDRWALVREIVMLRATGTPTHAVARQLIKLGACKGTGKAAEVAACITWMRKERHRWRQATVTKPNP